MLWLVYGIPGTGKTLIGGLQDNLIPAVQQHRKVYTNITGLSVAGISSVAKVPPVQVVINQVETIEDVLTAFDSEESTNSIFILDEMRQVLAGDAKLENWLSQRLNIMRKRSIDFIMIAQVPTYFSGELRELAMGCSLFKRAYEFGSKSHTREYRYNQGTPIMVKGKPAQFDGFQVRKINPIYFTCYSSYIDNQIQGNEDKTTRVSSFWKSPRAIIGYCFIVFVLCIIGFGIFMFLYIRSSVGEFTDSLTGRTSSEIEVAETETSEVGNEQKDCFSRIACDSIVCKTDKGNFPFNSYNADDNIIVLPNRVLALCGVD